MPMKPRERAIPFQMMLHIKTFSTIGVRLVADFRACRSLSSISASSLSTLRPAMQQLISRRHYQEALDPFDRHQQKASDPIITMALKASTALRDYQAGVRIHRRLTKQSMDNPYIRTSLIHFYMQCSDVQSAEKVFSAIEPKTVFMYGALFKGYNSNGMFEKVIELFESSAVKTDEVIMVLLFNACAKHVNERSIRVGREALQRLPPDFLYHENLVSAALDMLLKFGRVQDGEDFFRSLKKTSADTCGMMMQGYIDSDMASKALDLFEQISQTPNAVLYAIVFNACAISGDDRAVRLGNKLLRQLPGVHKSDAVITGSILKMLMRFGQVKDAEDVFRSIGKKNIVMYGVMMQGYSNNSQPQASMALFHHIIEEELAFNEAIFQLAISAAAQLGMRVICTRVTQCIPQHYRDSLRLSNALIDMWGKSAAIDQAEHIFHSISHPDSITYTCMINAYGRNGLGAETVDLYRRMPEEMRDGVSHVCVLNACSHAGLLDQARTIFEQVNPKTERVLTTMLDCLSRMFMFDEAKQLLEQYETTHPPSLIMYMTLLSAARNRRHSTLARTMYDRMMSLFPNEKAALITASILLSNTYSSIGDDQQAKEVRTHRLKHHGGKMQKSMTWAEVDGKIWEFSAHRDSHPQSAEIDVKLTEMLARLKEHGYEADRSWITRPLRDDETPESVLCGHSKRRALAFCLIQHPPPSTIQLTKNLRVCGDCHSATKLIARIYDCDIIVRDVNRIHHFHRNGQCSCLDHF